ncbi:hypothetical protein, partial [Pediococcus parvulus]|uniref:hypothetical protein n=1 Tax=Pediococcus parvulus TaxID=54062 RepID=UPI0021A89CF1
GDLWASFFFKKILLIDYHIGSSSTGKSIEPLWTKNLKQPNKYLNPRISCKRSSWILCVH